MARPPAEPREPRGSRALADRQGPRGQQLATSSGEAEQTLAWVSTSITRATEHISKSIAAVRTAARMARQAAEAFEAEAHTLQTALDTLQEIYSPGTHRVV